MGEGNIGAHRNGRGGGREAVRSASRWLGRRAVASVVLVVALTGCTPWLSMPTVWDGATRTIVDAPHSQAVIDAGDVVNWSGCWPGDGCTVHLAAHRTSHGGTFRALPDLAPGDIVELGYDEVVYRYRVTSVEVHLRASDYHRVIVGDLVLQTTAPEPGSVYLVYASLVA